MASPNGTREQAERRNSRPLSQVEIEGHIIEDVEALEDATEHFRDLGEVLARAEVAYKVGKAKAYMRRESGSIKDRDYYADVVTEDEFLEYKLAEASHKSQSQVLNTIRARIDAYRSLNANVRHQV